MNIPIFFIAAVAIAATNAMQVEVEWEIFKAKFGRNYVSGDEHDTRKAIFTNNLEFIQKHNDEAAMGLHTYTVGVNKFTDMTVEEFAKQYTAPMNRRNQAPKIPGLKTLPFPDSIDWRDEGYVTPVKDQDDHNGQYLACASCWAFSATGTMEGAWFKKTGHLVSLSEQNLMDCATEYPNDACNGGFPYIAINHTIYNGGIDTEESYQYEAIQGECRFNKSSVGATMTNMWGIVEGDEKELAYGVGNFGPISVCIDANHQSFMTYKSGIYSNKDCSTYYLDHAVLAIGYGTENGQDYWLLKNSWGAYWGMEGYFKMARNDGNMCGVASDAIIAVA